ncbi:fungal cellulose binding domain-containing protein [Apiospora marii]|uniref:fungal cellulose binding domain-containing protein n=1 Tax=Apiospora marii TaxID=335849 RepID=UPI003131AAB6
MKHVILITHLLGLVHAHYIFPNLMHDGEVTEDWAYVRQTSNYESQSPVMNASAAQVRCDELGSPPYSTGIRQVIAGETVGFRVSPSIQHPGPVAFYMAKAPKAHTAKTFDGDGDVWFKIAQEQPGFGPSQLTWPSEGRTELSVRIPQCIVAGEYLLRVEHLGLHGAYNIGGAQFFQACAQLSVSGTGMREFTGVHLPGAYSENDPGIHVLYPYNVERAIDRKGSSSSSL